MITSIGEPYAGFTRNGTPSKRILGLCSDCGSRLEYGFYFFKNVKACKRCCKSIIRDNNIYPYKKMLQKHFQCMKQRCNSVYNPSYHQYGAIGIKVIRKDSNEFIKDMGDSFIEAYNKYGKGKTTIDRIDSSKDYCKENCRRGDFFLQNNNLSSNKKYNVLGGIYTIPEISRTVGIKQETLYSRIRMGWTIEKAISKKIQKKTFFGYKV